jgi:N-acetyl-alpha-D-muramate 1-phosphate uridylyltransferase
MKSSSNEGLVPPTPAQEGNSPASLVSSHIWTGIHVISPRLLTMMAEKDVFSIIDCYLQIAAQKEAIVAFRADEWYWRDLGRPENLMQAARDLRQGVLR